MRVIINVIEKTHERYEVEYDGNIEAFDPIEHSVEKNLVYQKVIDSDYAFYEIKRRLERGVELDG